MRRGRTDRSGIAMLSSPVMRLSARDQWIGWLREAAQIRIDEGLWPAKEFGEALWTRLEASIAALRWDDLATAKEIGRRPKRCRSASSSAPPARRLRAKRNFAPTSRLIATGRGFGPIAAR